jgi:hypothetical protein
MHLALSSKLLTHFSIIPQSIYLRFIMEYTLWINGAMATDTQMEA